MIPYGHARLGETRSMVHVVVMRTGRAVLVPWALSGREARTSVSQHRCEAPRGMRCSASMFLLGAV